jgi:hypothetical protein
MAVSHALSPADWAPATDAARRSTMRTVADLTIMASSNSTESVIYRYYLEIIIKLLKKWKSMQTSLGGKT